MYGTHSLWKHVTRIIISLGKPPKRKWLTWGASGNDVNTAERLEIELSNISLMDKMGVEVLP